MDGSSIIASLEAAESHHLKVIWDTEDGLTCITLYDENNDGNNIATLKIMKSLRDWWPIAQGEFYKNRGK